VFRSSFIVSVAVVSGLAARSGSAQEPQMASVVQPLPVPWEECKLRARAALKAQGYSGFLESGNGWIARARGTSASIVCVPQSGRTVLVIVTAGGQLVKESKRLYEAIRGPEPPAPAAVPESTLTPAADTTASGWDATASGLANHLGSRYTFWCPPRGIAHAVWGDLVYTSDSSVCTAAAHAGTLTTESGGNAIIEMVAGRQSYSSSSRHGVVTQARGPGKASFVVVGRAP
jgi:hypothetical protein